MNKRPSDDNKALIEASILRRSTRKAVQESTQPKTTTRRTDDEVTYTTNYDGNHIPTATIEIKKTNSKEGYEYLDHTADIQLHAWGTNLSSCLINLIKCMFNYMTNLDLIHIDIEYSAKHATNISVQGHDMTNLIFTFMDEWLFIFHDTGFVVKDLEILSIDINNEEEQFTIVSSGRGEKFDLGKHTQGTEIKAITYSNLQINISEKRCDVWVIVDI